MGRPIRINRPQQEQYKLLAKMASLLIGTFGGISVSKKCQTGPTSDGVPENESAVFGVHGLYGADR